MECSKPIFLKKQGLDVPCGKCGNCLKRRITDWTIRCENELKNSKYALFVTLTYAKDPLQLYKVDLQKFFKRVRRAGGEFSYLAVGDYGDTFGRPHYHVLMFVKNDDFPAPYIDKLWQSGDGVRHRGFVDVKECSIGRIRYVVKYGLLARLDWDKTVDGKQAPFFLMSKRPALGLCYLTEKRSDWHKKGQIRYYPYGEFKVSLPRYYRDKIFRPNKALAELEKDKYLSERLERRDDLMRKQSKNGDQEPYLTYYDRLIETSNQFLKTLRTQKRLKNKNL